MLSPNPTLITIASGQTTSDPVNLGALGSLRRLIALVTAPATLTGTVKAEVAAIGWVAGTIGAGANGVVTVRANQLAEPDSAFTIEILLPTDPDLDLEATITSGAIVVSLGTDGLGDPDDTKNTAALIAAAIDALPNLVATASGTGATPLDAAVAEAPLTGPVYGTLVIDGSDLAFAAGESTSFEILATYFRLKSSGAEAADRLFSILVSAL
jgi:hypothetical protein